MRPRHVPVEVLGLEVEREEVSEERVERGGDVPPSPRRSDLRRRRQRGHTPGSRFDHVHDVCPTAAYCACSPWARGTS